MLLTECYSLNATHQCFSPNATHRMLLTESYSLNATHRMLLTDCYSPNATHRMLLTECYSPNATHRKLLTECSPNTAITREERRSLLNLSKGYLSQACTDRENQRGKGDFEESKENSGNFFCGLKKHVFQTRLGNFLNLLKFWESCICVYPHVFLINDSFDT